MFLPELLAREMYPTSGFFLKMKAYNDLIKHTNAVFAKDGTFHICMGANQMICSNLTHKPAFPGMQA
jgi:hypothetical protein